MENPSTPVEANLLDKFELEALNTSSQTESVVSIR